ncbi:MAG: class I SAM-dependent methyltransferase [Candidatus Abyssobacteria bacterium SURF_5]|uniref:Class I SAM-dependent methyltransferase n=1 Tax=Abyssobacteria bacterium (strain SURF_5) TaxID=2093360 RepID=A0A3A4NVT6_ABYX5|nr:MAG: class I SAM-dependent methyltransferase [Candidatus Abyssubacteria bacterium SURF_5]
MSSIEVCRSCDSPSLEVILSLGRTPLANALLDDEQLNRPEPEYPLELAFCPVCSLVQLTETVPPDLLFREYLYFSSFSDTMLKHAEQLVEGLIEKRRLDGKSLVVEIASNDGYLLQYYHRKKIRTLGIEPAVNVARVAREERGIPTVCEFFGEDLARSLREDGKQADVIHAHNVLAHAADLKGFVRGIKLLLKDGGVAVIEAPYLVDLIEHCEFDTIYHEHLCYFSLTSLVNLFRPHDLSVVHVERMPIHGGSLRLFLAKNSPQGAVVDELLRQEAERGISHEAFYAAFADRVGKLKTDLVDILSGLKRSGKRIAAYGAAAKGSTLLNYCGIGRKLIDFVVDRSTYKQGRHMPGVHLPIYAPEKLLEEVPDYVLLLTWNFADEILRQQSEYRRRGGRFIIPVPEVRVL